MIRLHHVPFSRSFRILWLLHELGLEFEIVYYKITDGSLRAEEMQKVSPAARVPGLEIDELMLCESGAIIQYLCESNARFECPKGHPERPRFLMLMHYSETLAGQIEQLNLQRIFLRPPAEASPTVVKINTKRLEAALRGLEAMLGDHEYLLASGFSGADMMMGFDLFAAPYYVSFDSFPGLAAYRKRLEARPAYRAARAEDGPQEFYTQDFYGLPA